MVIKTKPQNKDKSKIKSVKEKDVKSGSTYRDPMKGRSFFQGIMNFFKFALTKRSNIIIADMQLSTGDFEHVPVEVIEGKFKWRKGMYLVSDEYLVFNRTFKMHTCKYHQGISLPIKQFIDSLEIKKELSNYKSFDLKNATLKPEDVVTNIDPVILAKWSESTLVQQAIAGAQMEDAMKSLKLWVMFGTVASVIALFLVLKMGGFINV